MADKMEEKTVQSTSKDASKKRKIDQLDGIQITQGTVDKKLKMVNVKNEQNDENIINENNVQRPDEVEMLRKVTNNVVDTTFLVSTIDEFLQDWYRVHESDQNEIHSSPPINENNANNDLHTRSPNVNNYEKLDANVKVDVRFQANSWKYAYDVLTKDVNMNYIIGGEHFDKMSQNISLIYDGTDNGSPLNTVDQNNSQSQEFVCPPLEWTHLIYLAIKNSNCDFVTIFEIEKFVKRWFPYYLRKRILNEIYSALKRYDQCFTSCHYLTEKNVWTINSEFVNIFEEETMFYVKNNEEVMKTAMRDPDQLPNLLKGYGVLYLGYDKCMFG